VRGKVDFPLPNPPPPGEGALGFSANFLRRVRLNQQSQNINETIPKKKVLLQAGALKLPSPFVKGDRGGFAFDCWNQIPPCPATGTRPPRILFVFVFPLRLCGFALNAVWALGIGSHSFSAHDRGKLPTTISGIARFINQFLTIMITPFIIFISCIFISRRHAENSLKNKRLHSS
jgi:hypothetical protein